METMKDGCNSVDAKDLPRIAVNDAPEYTRWPLDPMHRAEWRGGGAKGAEVCRGTKARDPSGAVMCMWFALTELRKKIWPDLLFRNRCTTMRTEIHRQRQVRALMKE